jgi:hypothetical protein
MSNEKASVPVSIDIDDLTEVVGGATFAVTSLNQSLVAASPLVNVAFDPNTCPTTPGGPPPSTCMCPSSKVGLGGSILVNQAIRY